MLKGTGKVNLFVFTIVVSTITIVFTGSMIFASKDEVNARVNGIKSMLEMIYDSQKEMRRDIADIRKMLTK